jgi:predicted metal-dependent hydrolase
MIEYKVRFSVRSRNVRLTITPDSGLEVVVPCGFDPVKIPSILLQKHDWIQKAFRKIEKQRLFIAEPQSKELPIEINLKSVEKIWKVSILTTDRKKNYLLEENDHSIRLYLRTENPHIGFHLLQKWIEKKAIQILPSWLHRFSMEHGFEYKNITMRRQRMRWGSCSNRKNISLNRTLVFLPRQLVEYVMLHELCHTIEMNHSSKYWALVEKHCPQYKEYDKELKQARHLVPAWMLFRK